MVLQRFSGFSFFIGYKLATFEAFFVARGSRHDAVKLSGYLHLLVGVQVAVRVHRGLYFFVSEPLRDQQRGEAHLYQQAGVAVTNIMHPYPLHARRLAAVLHFVIQKALGVGKEPVVLLQPVAMGYILLQTGAKTVWNGDGAVALGCFWRGDDVLSAKALIALVHRQGLLFKVDVRRRERQQLSLPNPRVVHGHKNRVAGGAVFHALDKGLKLVLRPEQHLVGVLLAHAPCLVAGIFFQPVVFDCVVENCRELYGGLHAPAGAKAAVFSPRPPDTAVERASDISDGGAARYRQPLCRCGGGTQPDLPGYGGGNRSRRAGGLLAGKVQRWRVRRATMSR